MLLILKIVLTPTQNKNNYVTLLTITSHYLNVPVELGIIQQLFL